MSAPGDIAYEFYFAELNEHLYLIEETKNLKEGSKMAERFVTPKAKCLWANLQEPNVSTDETIADAFQITLVLGKEHKELLDQIAALHKDAGGTQEIGDRGHPIKFHYDEEKQKIPGWYEVRFKSLAQYVDHIPTFDAKGAKILREKNFVANESVVRVSWSFKYYNTAGNKGVSLFLLGVQVIELIEWQGYSSDELGFVEEKGYEEYGGAVSQKIAENEAAKADRVEKLHEVIFQPKPTDEDELPF